jgi:galactitol-specific phosphotransferase system IIB component
MIAGTPGSFKSVDALNICVSWAQRGIGSLYLSADSDEFSVVNRLSGILTGDSMETIERRLVSGDSNLIASYVRELESLKGVEFEYEQMDIDGVQNRMKAYEQIYCQYPPVVFIDNLIDFVDQPDDFGGMLTFIRDLNALAGQTRSHICVLHHAKLPGGQTKNTNVYQPPADWEIQGKVTQLSRLVLTVCANGLDQSMSVVKNTLGPQHRDASVWMTFQVQPSMQVTDLQQSNRS